MENDINREISIEHIDYNIDINSENYTIEINPQSTFEIQLNEQGPQGARGYAATINIGEVNTLEPGSQVTVTNSGDETDAILNFSIPGSYDINGSTLVDVNKNGFNVTISSKDLEFEQAIANDTWVIDHNLNKKPSVFVIDSSGSVQIPDEIKYDSNNRMTLYFINAFAGTAILN